MTNSVLVLPDDDPEPPLNLNGVRPFLICCDESGMHKANFYGFGTLWLPYDRRGDFYDGIRRICAQHHMNFGVVNDKKHEFKWSKVSPQKLGFYQSIVDYFFERPELCFHCLVVRRAEVKLELHKGGYEEARQKHLTMLLTNKIRRALQVQKRKFRVWVDPLPVAYDKAPEVVQIISNHTLNQDFKGLNPVDKVLPHESHDTPAIQLCDVLLGAVMSAWQNETAAAAKLELQRHIAGYLGWTDLRADTFPREKKFNIWFFANPHKRPPNVPTRRVQLAEAPLFRRTG